MRFVKGSLLAIASVASLVACKSERIDREGDREQRFDRTRAADAAAELVGTTTVTAGDLATLGNEAAIGRIIKVRCDRETACNNVGPEKRYTNLDVCTRTLAVSMNEELRAGDCTHGINVPELDKCVEAIRTESCNDVVETLARIRACRASEICFQVVHYQ